MVACIQPAIGLGLLMEAGHRKFDYVYPKLTGRWAAGCEKSQDPALGVGRRSLRSPSNCWSFLSGPGPHGGGGWQILRLLPGAEGKRQEESSGSVPHE